MKKKWLISSVILGVLGTGAYVWNRFSKKDIKQDDGQRDAIAKWFEDKGYKVHVYNEKNDFMLFHYEKNDKRHVFYDDGESTYEQFAKKLQAYYLHFTNEFYFICKNEEVVEEITKKNYELWKSSLDEKTLVTYGNIRSYFMTVDELLSDDFSF